MKMKLPWKKGLLDGWDIVGMNHYRQDGSRKIFVAMSRGGQCIKTEGFDEEEIWEELARQASYYK